MKIVDDDRGFSTSIDAILFLILVSVSAVILFPSIAADDQYRSASYASAQDMDTKLMNTIMSSNVQEFEYTVKPAELAGIDVNLSEDSILGNAEETLFAKEQQHRTFSDLVAEGLVLGLVMDQNGTEKPLNPMTKMQNIETSKAIEEHLERTIGQRYNYRFEAHWQPVSGYKIHSDIIIGETVPEDVVKRKARISLPVTYTIPKNEIYQPFNESTIYIAISSPDSDKKLHEMFNSSVATASEGAGEIITEIVFPYEYLSSLNGTEISLDSEQLACIAGPDNANYSSPIIKGALGCMNYTVNDLYGLNIEMRSEEQSISLDIVDTTYDLIKEKNTKQISEHIIKSQSGDINRTVMLMCNASDNSSRLDLANTQLSKIHRTANPGGADIVIMIW
jgi:hypothetical protein